MKNVPRFLGWTSAALLLFGVLAAGLVYWRSESVLQRRREVAVELFDLPQGPEAVAHGAHIARSRGCTDCHGADFGGALVADDPMIGRIHGPNLTRGRGGIGATLDDEAWIRAIRHGVGRNGRGLLLMPAEDYAAFSRADLGGLIVFAKSVPPVDREWSAPRLGPLGRFLVAIGEIELSADRIDHAAVTPSEVPVGESPEYGRYLAMSCTGCHGADLSGGRIAGAPPDWPPARNLTPDPASGIKSWTQADFFNALRAGRRPDGAEIHPAMPRSFGLMTDEEIRALWMYLETLPPVAAAR